LEKLFLADPFELSLIAQSLLVFEILSVKLAQGLLKGTDLLEVVDHVQRLEFGGLLITEKSGVKLEQARGQLVLAQVLLECAQELAEAGEVNSVAVLVQGLGQPDEEQVQCLLAQGLGQAQIGYQFVQPRGIQELVVGAVPEGRVVLEEPGQHLLQALVHL
jgi:hypothetical protein